VNAARWLLVLSLAALLVALRPLGRPSGDVAPGRPSGAAWRTKPRPGVGRLSLEVVERPSTGRAVLEARWSLASGAGDAALDLLLPEGADLVEGERRTALPSGLREGTVRWAVEHATDGTLDVAARLAAGVGKTRRSLEAYARLVGAGIEGAGAASSTMEDAPSGT